MLDRLGDRILRQIRYSTNIASAESARAPTSSQQDPSSRFCSVVLVLQCLSDMPVCVSLRLRKPLWEEQRIYH